jgi:guanylate kinase
MLVISSPSGAGKTTLAEGLLKSDQQLSMSVSVTTRKPRPGERDGVDYYFVDDAEFEAMRERGDLLESASVFGNSYGTPRKPVEDLLAAGRDVLFDVDWQGASQLASACGDDLCRVFILPPSGAALEQRLKGRGKDAPEVVEKRMAEAANEIAHWNDYDYVIINDVLEEAQTRLKAVLAAERSKRERMVFLDGFVRDMLAAL